MTAINHTFVAEWLVNSTTHAKTLLKADMIADGEKAPYVEDKPWIFPAVPSGKLYTTSFSKHLKDQAEPMRQRHQLSGARGALYDLVAEQTKIASVEVEERTWCRLSCKDIAEELGIHSDYARKIYQGNPFRHTVKMVEGRKQLHLRIASPSDATLEDQARQMAKHWRTYRKKRETNDEFGLLVGMARSSPTGMTLDIFRTVLSNWTPFMAGAKVAQFKALEEGDYFDPNPENFEVRFLRWPNIAFMRRFWYVAVDMYKMHVQWAISPKYPDVYDPIVNRRVKRDQIAV